jgi:dTDP-4-amino-4,6-dideoxygalactose transaminase
MVSGKLAIHGGIPIRTEPYHPIWPNFGKEEERQLLDVLRITKEGMGKPIGKITEFEKKFAVFHHAEAAVACSNCSQALEIMLAVAGVKPGDEVIVPPFTYVATAGAVVAIGAIPVFADINPKTYQIDPFSIEEMITSRTTAIVPVHFAGHFADMKKICAIADRHNLIVIEDAAQAHGAKWNGKYPGQYSKAAGFSFQYGKNMTSQEGGAIISQDSNFIEKCWEYIWYGRHKGEPWYQHYRITSNYRLTEFQGAILLAQLAKLPEENKKRSVNADHLDSLLEEVEGATPASVDSRMEVHPRHLYPIRFSSEVIEKAGSKKALVEAVNAEGIPLLFGYEFPLYRAPAFLDKKFRADEWFRNIYASVDYSKVELPESEKACHETSWFLHSALLGNKQDIIDMSLALEKIITYAEELKG